ncbi:MAG: hypothetical protein HYX27_03630 [Acidobacteria bacterium]|nr:hypothetical protein [Acidobacteriota bacterium]
MKMLLRLGLAMGILATVLPAQKLRIVPAEPVYFPGVADSNSPIHWSNGTRYVYNSDGLPLRSEGVELGSMRYARPTYLLNSDVSPWWMEATYRDEDGTVYGWYHHEIYNYCPMDADRYIGVPVIGAVVSKDNGRTFTDLGFVLTDGYEPNCATRNGYFAGGHGDFSVILDREKKYFYFLFSVYGGPATEQGVAIARMAFGDRDAPAGRVFKFYNDGWESEGLNGKVTPIFAVKTPWESEHTDAMWGPAVHYNRELGEYVMLLNHACCDPGWPAEGIFVSFASSLENPKAWSEPERLLQGGGWYPLAVGIDAGDTDKDAGARARFFMGSDSNYELIFRKGHHGVLPLTDRPERLR